jgi:radical SAM protein with 4Fe4S-binding SPASM domain
MALLREVRRRNPEYYSSRVSIACCIDRNKSLIDLLRFFDLEEFDGIKVSFNPIKEDDNGFYVEDEGTRRHYGSELGRMIDLYLSNLRSGGRFNHPLFRELLFRVFKLGWDPITPSVARDRFPNPICLPGISKIYAASDGTFYPCERFRLRGTEIGDYRTGVDLEKVRALVQMFSDFCAENCGSCWAHGLCCHCFVHFLDHGKIRRQKKLDYCRREKEALVEGFRRFIYIWENEPPSARRNPDSLHSRLEKVQYSVLHSLETISNS